MSGVTEAVLIVAVLTIVSARQMKPYPSASVARCWWLFPAVLVVVALRGPGLIDSRRGAASAGLPACGAVVGFTTGVAWAWTTRITGVVLRRVRGLRPMYRVTAGG